MNSKPFFLFTDGSVNTQSKVGYGAALFISDLSSEVGSFKTLVKTKRFEDTSSTGLELQTLLWALKAMDRTTAKVTVYTDSQNIINLPGRRNRLEQRQYRSKKGIRIKHWELYQAFFEMMDALDCDFFKVRGHQRTHLQDKIAQIFSLVDKASRLAVRIDSKTHSGDEN